MPNKIKHLEMIESIITRMANNSFKLKGWAVAVLSLVGTLLSMNQNKIWLLVLLVPILAFWAMDARYLQQERQFRVLYDYIREKDEKDIDFNMNINQAKIAAGNKKLCYMNCFISWSESLFYIFIIAALIGMYFILRTVQ